MVFMVLERPNASDIFQTYLDNRAYCRPKQSSDVAGGLCKIRLFRKCGGDQSQKSRAGAGAGFVSVT
jgi:hypothetical protein